MPLPPAPTKRAALLSRDALKAPERAQSKAGRKQEGPSSTTEPARLPQTTAPEPTARAAALPDGILLKAWVSVGLWTLVPLAGALAWFRKQDLSKE